MVAMKADSERQRRNAPSFEWVNLPKGGRGGKAPGMPKGRQWSTATRSMWRDLWKLPQAVMWDPAWPVFSDWCLLREAMLEKPMASTSAELRMLEDRLGLNPKAMLALRWRIVDDEQVEKVTTPGAKARKRYGHLQVAG